MMAGVRLSSFLFLAVIVVLLGMFARELLAEEPATTTYKSTTIERVTTTREETRVEVPVQKERPVCAVFMKNHAANIPDDKIEVLQDFVSAHVTEAGLTLIARENVINSVKAFADAGPNQGNDARPGADLDTILSNNTSALQLARKLGADAILNLSISSYGTDRTSYTGHNLNVTSINHRLKVSFELLDVLRGGSRTAGVVTVSFTDRKQDGLETVRENVLDDLLDGAAADAAGHARLRLPQRQDRRPRRSGQGGPQAGRLHLGRPPSPTSPCPRSSAMPPANTPSAKPPSPLKSPSPLSNSTASPSAIPAVPCRPTPASTSSASATNSSRTGKAPSSSMMAGGSRSRCSSATLAGALQGHDGLLR